MLSVLYMNVLDSWSVRNLCFMCSLCVCSLVLCVCMCKVSSEYKASGVFVAITLCITFSAEYVIMWWIVFHLHAVRMRVVDQ